MSAETFTPGPWFKKGARIFPSRTSFNAVCTVQASNVLEWEANARLIAAAPQLLDALMAALPLLECTDFSTGVCCCGNPVEGHGIGMMMGHSPVDEGDYYADGATKQVRAAIAAATGEA